MQNISINLVLIFDEGQACGFILLFDVVLEDPPTFLTKRGLLPHPKTERGCSGEKIGFLFHNRFYLFDNLTPIQVGCIYWTRHLKRTLNTQSSFVLFWMFQVFVNIHKLNLQGAGDGLYGFLFVEEKPQTNNHEA